MGRAPHLGIKWNGMSSYLKSLCLPVGRTVAGKICHRLVNSEHFAVTDSSSLRIASLHDRICPNNLHSSSVVSFYHGIPGVSTPPLPILTLGLVFLVAMIVHSTDPFPPRSLPTIAFTGLGSSHCWAPPSIGSSPVRPQPSPSATRQ